MALCWWELQICWSIEAGEFHPGSALRFAHCELEWRLADRNVPSANPSEMRALSTIQARAVLSQRARCLGIYAFVGITVVTPLGFSASNTSTRQSELGVDSGPEIGGGSTRCSPTYHRFFLKDGDRGAACAGGLARAFSNIVQDQIE